MRTRASYRVVGTDRSQTAAIVTAALGIHPSESHEVGERARPRSPVATRSWWSLASGDNPDTGVELSAQIRRVLNILLPRCEQLWQLSRDGYVMDWSCYLGSHAAEHAAELPRDLMRDLLLVPGEVLLDVYDDYDEQDNP